MVDLPQPLCPTMATVWPAGTCTIDENKSAFVGNDRQTNGSTTDPQRSKKSVATCSTHKLPC